LTVRPARQDAVYLRRMTTTALHVLLPSFICMCNIIIPIQFNKNGAVEGRGVLVLSVLKNKIILDERRLNWAISASSLLIVLALLGVILCDF